jgi:6-hydroxycyclohex-1-ene-1-carbonyl-CoA dehydrogenase
MDLWKRQEQVDKDEVLVQVAACGICRTDLAFYFDGFPTRRPLPLTLGHEVSGTVVEAGWNAQEWLGRQVIVHSLIPCGDCEDCRAGHPSICPQQLFLGNDLHGGFGTHLRVPARGLCSVPDLEDEKVNPNGLDLADLATVPDGIAVCYQAALRCELSSGDLAIFIGVGAVGGFGVQVARALGATVIALDKKSERLEEIRSCGASLTLQCQDRNIRDLKTEVRRFARQREIPSWRQRIFETSGTPEGQKTAFRLLAPGGVVSLIGYTPEEVKLRLSNLTALDATVQGNWGCVPEHYPAALDLVLSGKVAVKPFIERRQLQSINEAFRDVREGLVRGKVLLIPE